MKKILLFLLFFVPTFLSPMRANGSKKINFYAIYKDIPKDLKKKITGVSYNPECIDIKELCLLKVLHWGFDGKIHEGEMIVNKKIAGEVIDIFSELFTAKYPIEKIRLINEYDADDDKSMEDNNSSALCCRVITGDENKQNPRWSLHSYGTAIDINPFQNPYVKPKKNLVLPKGSEEYVDRTNVRLGMIVKGDACHKAFTSRGWIWGGDWDVNDEKGRVDYQHFHKELG